MTHLLLLALLTADPTTGQPDFCPPGMYCVGPLAADAPVLETRPAMALKAGEAMPYDGVAMPDALAVATAKRLASAEAQVKAVEGKTVSTPVLVLAVVASVVVAGAVGAAAGYALAKK